MHTNEHLVAMAETACEKEAAKRGMPKEIPWADLIAAILAALGVCKRSGTLAEEIQESPRIAKAVVLNCCLRMLPYRQAAAARDVVITAAKAAKPEDMATFETINVG